MTNFKTSFWKISKWFAGIFVLLFIFRLIYGFVATDSDRNYSNNDYSGSFFSNIDNLRKNYASEKISVKGDMVYGSSNTTVNTAANVASNQKFEKTASIKTKTSEFEKDEKLLKSKTKAYNAVIQYEQNLGQKENRQIHLLIGVNPALFDSFYVDIQKIGLVKETEVTKVDKTNEYRQLNAKKTSIEKTLESLKELKSKGGQISDFISLNDKILETEEKLQGLGVELGNFDTENEFCTVKLSMYEGVTEKKISLIHRLKTALEWTIKYFAVLVATTLILVLTIFIMLLIADKLKIIDAVKKMINE